MLKVDAFEMHAQHRKATLEHAKWLEDIARWREERSRAAGMLEAVKTAWGQAEAALEEHARQIEILEVHSGRHEQMFCDEGWAVDLFEDVPIVAEHQDFRIAHAEARKVHNEMEQLYSGVMAEVLELLKLTHPDAVVLETN